MKKLLEYAEAGDTVVVWRVDRLGRSLIDVLNTVNLLRERGVNVRSIADGIDPATSTGRMMLNLLASLAEYERELIVERVNAGIAAARQSGTRFGRPLSDPAVIADKLAIAKDARAKGRTAEDAARLVGWSRATLYRHLGQDARSIKSHVIGDGPAKRCGETRIAGPARRRRPLDAHRRRVGGAAADTIALVREVPCRPRHPMA